MMNQKIIGVIAIAIVTEVWTASIYDQRQEGKVNVQIDVKDLQIVALVDSDMLDDYMSYDYAYDYADFTIKPSSRPTTSKPTTSSTVEIWSTWPTKPSTVASDTTNAITNISTTATNVESSTTTKSSTTILDNSSHIGNAVTTETSIPVTIIFSDNPDATGSKIENKNTDVLEKEQSSNDTSTASSASTVLSEVTPDGTKRPLGFSLPRKRCPVGFLLKSGKCFKRRLSFISPRLAIMKLAPALLNRSKLLTRNLTAKDS